MLIQIRYLSNICVLTVLTKSVKKTSEVTDIYYSKEGTKWFLSGYMYKMGLVPNFLEKVVFKFKVRVMMFNASFKNISAISLRPVFIGGGNPNCRKSLTNFITKCCIEHTSP